MPRHILNASGIRGDKFTEALSVSEDLEATIVDNVRFSEFSRGYYDQNRDEWELAFLVELRESTFLLLARGDHGLILSRYERLFSRV